MPMQSGLDGVSLQPFLISPEAKSAKPALGFWSGGQRTVRTERWRLIRKKAKDDLEPQFELFDCQNDPDETTNVAHDHSATVEELSRLLDTQW